VQESNEGTKPTPGTPTVSQTYFINSLHYILNVIHELQKETKKSKKKFKISSSKSKNDQTKLTQTPEPPSPQPPPVPLRHTKALSFSTKGFIERR
jgi:hypothetical protein